MKWIFIIIIVITSIAVKPDSTFSAENDCITKQLEANIVGIGTYKEVDHSLSDGKVTKRLYNYPEATGIECRAHYPFFTEFSSDRLPSNTLDTNKVKSIRAYQIFGQIYVLTARSGDSWQPYLLVDSTVGSAGNSVIVGTYWVKVQTEDDRLLWNTVNSGVDNRQQYDIISNNVWKNKVHPYLRSESKSLYDRMQKYANIVASKSPGLRVLGTAIDTATNNEVSISLNFDINWKGSSYSGQLYNDKAAVGIRDDFPTPRPMTNVIIDVWRRPTGISGATNFSHVEKKELSWNEEMKYSFSEKLTTGTYLFTTTMNIDSSFFAKQNGLNAGNNFIKFTSLSAYSSNLEQALTSLDADITDNHSFITLGKSQLFFSATEATEVNVETESIQLTASANLQATNEEEGGEGGCSLTWIVGNFGSAPSIIQKLGLQKQPLNPITKMSVCVYVWAIEPVIEWASELIKYASGISSYYYENKQYC